MKILKRSYIEEGLMGELKSKAVFDTKCRVRAINTNF